VNQQFHERNKKRKPSLENLFALQQTFYLAQEMGEKLE
jgi:hypothetical protein